jgi:energy-converting hydrogenase Eha subunit A
MRTSLLENVELTREELSDHLRALPRGVRFALGLVGSSLLGYYLPLLVVVALGTWQNSLTFVYQILASCAIMMVLNIIGYFIGHPIKVGIVAGTCLSLFFVIVDIYQRCIWWSVLRDCFVVGFMPVVNAWLFSKYMQSVGPFRAHNATSVEDRV